MRSIYFHEDNYLQLEVLPIEAKPFCLRQMREIEVFAREHQGEAGYTDVYRRERASCATRDLRLSEAQLAAALSFLPVFDRVETGYGGYREECKTICARGLGQELAVFWEPDMDGRVENLWLELCIDSEQTEPARQVLTALGTMASLLLADWSGGECVDLSSAEEIERYIEGKAANFLYEAENPDHRG